MNIIQTKKLTKYYTGGKVKALNELDLKIAEGEIFGFIGPNGAGKTTTIRLLLDLIRPTAGSAKIFDLDINQHSLEIRKEIGYLPGEIFLPDSMKGKECLDFFSGFKGRKIDQKYLKNLIDRFDLDTNKRIRDYSKGNKQKLAIVLAFMHKPKLLILDEPTSGLDPLNQQEFFNIILKAKDNGTTIFLSTHILNEAEKACDRVGIIKEGRLLAVENIDQFREKNIHEIHIETDQNILLEELKLNGIQKVVRTTTGYHLIFSGKNGELIKKLAKFDIKDIRIIEPSLEEVFLHFYKK